MRSSASSDQWLDERTTNNQSSDQWLDDWLLVVLCVFFSVVVCEMLLSCHILMKYTFWEAWSSTFWGVSWPFCNHKVLDLRHTYSKNYRVTMLFWVPWGPNPLLGLYSMESVSKLPLDRSKWIQYKFKLIFNQFFAENLWGCFFIYVFTRQPGGGGGWGKDILLGLFDVLS